MTVISTLDFDTIAEAATVTVSDPWHSLGVAPTGAAAAAVHGGSGARWSSTGSYGTVRYDFGSNQSGPVVLSWYMQLRAFSTSNQYIASAYSLNSGGTLQGDVRINPSRTVSLRDGLSAVASSSATVSLDTVYRCEWRLNTATQIQELRVYGGDSSTPFFNVSGIWTSSQTRVLTFGPNAAAAGGAIDYDTVRVADDWTGPFVSGAPVTPWRVHTVSGWEPAYLHRI